MEVLKVEKIAQSYAGLQVLRDVSFSLNAGEKVGLIGPNGAGKTTLLNVLSGLLHPTAGKMFLLGNNVTNMPPHNRVSLGLARSFQITSLFPNLTLLENIILAIHGVQPSRYQMFRPVMSFKEHLNTAEQLLSSVDLWGKRNSTVQALSHGEQRQIEILFAMSSRPKILLLDEPSSGLNAAETHKLAGTIRGSMQDTAVMLVAHDLDLVYEICDRIMVLYYGNIIAEGTCKDIQANPKVQQIYLGTEEVSSCSN